MITTVCICEDCYEIAVEALGDETAHYYTLLCRRFAEYGPVPTIFSSKGQMMVDILEASGYVTTSEVDQEGELLKLKPNGATFDEEDQRLVICPNCSKI